MFPVTTITDFYVLVFEQYAKVVLLEQYQQKFTFSSIEDFTYITDTQFNIRLNFHKAFRIKFYLLILIN